MRPASSLVAPVKESSASWSPLMTSGSTPQDVEDPADEVLAVLGVAGGGGGDEAHAFGAVLAR